MRTARMVPIAVLVTPRSSARIAQPASRPPRVVLTRAPHPACARIRRTPSRLRRSEPLGAAGPPASVSSSLHRGAPSGGPNAHPAERPRRATCSRGLRMQARSSARAAWVWYCVALPRNFPGCSYVRSQRSCLRTSGSRYSSAHRRYEAVPRVREPLRVQRALPNRRSRRAGVGLRHAQLPKPDGADEGGIDTVGLTGRVARREGRAGAVPSFDAQVERDGRGIAEAVGVCRREAEATGGLAVRGPAAWVTPNCGTERCRPTCQLPSTSQTAHPGLSSSLLTIEVHPLS